MKKKKNLVRKGFWVNEDQAKKIKKLAKYEGKSESQVVRDLLDDIII